MVSGFINNVSKRLPVHDIIFKMAGERNCADSSDKKSDENKGLFMQVSI